VLRKTAGQLAADKSRMLRMILELGYCAASAKTLNRMVQHRHREQFNGGSKAGQGRQTRAPAPTPSHSSE
jgi:hypothetical protein